jgi:hypothetical protein
MAVHRCDVRLAATCTLCVVCADNAAALARGVCRRRRQSSDAGGPGGERGVAIERETYLSESAGCAERGEKEEEMAQHRARCGVVVCVIACVCLVTKPRDFRSLFCFER